MKTSTTKRTNDGNNDNRNNDNKIVDESFLNSSSSNNASIAICNSTSTSTTSSSCCACWHVVNLYHFVTFANVQQVRRDVQNKCQQLLLKGSLWIASEGFNGTLTVYHTSPAPLYEMIQFLESYIMSITGSKIPTTTTTTSKSSSSSLLECKFSTTSIQPYPRLLIKIKKEIVTMGVPSLLAELSCSSSCCDTTTTPSTSNDQQQQRRVVGQYVEPQHWNALITSPHVLCIDVRNEYEIELGTFRNAVNPHTRSFSDFPFWWQTHGIKQLMMSNNNSVDNHHDDNNNTDDNQEESKTDATTTTTTKPSNLDNDKNQEDENSTVKENDDTNNTTTAATGLSAPSDTRRIDGPFTAVAMFCTGGIRCEKSTHYLLQHQQQESQNDEKQQKQQVPHHHHSKEQEDVLSRLPPNIPVYHLKGGILKYLETIVDPNQSTWMGHCFVFDQRVSVTHGLQRGPHTLCYACRRPFLLLQPEAVEEEVVVDDDDDDDQTEHRDVHNKSSNNDLSTPSTPSSNLYEPGVSCPRCYYETTPEQKRRFRERQQQKDQQQQAQQQEIQKQQGQKSLSASRNSFSSSSKKLKTKKKQDKD